MRYWDQHEVMIIFSSPILRECLALPYSAKRIAEGMGNVKKLIRFSAGNTDKISGRKRSLMFLCLFASVIRRKRKIIRVISRRICYTCLIQEKCRMANEDFSKYGETNGRDIYKSLSLLG